MAEKRWTPAGNVQIRGQQPTDATAGVIQLAELLTVHICQYIADTNILAECLWRSNLIKWKINLR
jgi:hypothetical protein